MQPDTLTIAALALVLFGVAYNALVARFGRQVDGYIAFVIAFGEVVILLAAAIVYGLPIAAGLLLLHAAAGAPMIIGSVARHTARTELEQRRAEELAARLLREEDH